MAIRLVVFDVGETLVDETRQWGEWAEWLGVGRLVFFAALGAVIAERQHHREVFPRVRPGLDQAAATAARRAQGWASALVAADLYPDAAPCLARLRDAGYRVGIVGNQGAAVTAQLRELGIAADFTGSSEEWGVEKPDPAFFRRLTEVAGVAAHQIAYVGDRLDNDVLPAQAAGMRGVFLRRGPWGVVQAIWPEAALADLHIERLDELPPALARLSAG